jgi:hypothetical protein
MVKTSTVFYIIIMTAFTVWFIADLFSTTYGGQFIQGKNKGEMGMMSMIIIISAVIFNMIWGGIFWW